MIDYSFSIEQEDGKLYISHTTDRRNPLAEPDTDTYSLPEDRQSITYLPGGSDDLSTSEQTAEKIAELYRIAAPFYMDYYNQIGERFAMDLNMKIVGDDSHIVEQSFTYLENILENLDPDVHELLDISLHIQGGEIPYTCINDVCEQYGISLYEMILEKTPMNLANSDQELFIPRIVCIGLPEHIDQIPESKHLSLVTEGNDREEAPSRTNSGSQYVLPFLETVGIVNYD